MLYEIRIGGTRPCELWAVSTDGKTYRLETLITSGTYTYCKQVKERLEDD
jgi:hypothetical protein